MNLGREPVQLGVCPRGLDGERIGIHADRPAGAEPQGRQGEDPRATADVEKPLGRSDLLEHLEACAGRRVQAGAERHSRIERDGHLVRRERLVDP